MLLLSGYLSVTFHVFTIGTHCLLKTKAVWLRACKSCYTQISQGPAVILYSILGHDL